MENFEKQFLLPYLVKPHDVIKRQIVRKLCISILALPYTTNNEKCFFVYLIYLNPFKTHFWWRDFGVSTALRDWQLLRFFCNVRVTAEPKN